MTTPLVRCLITGCDLIFTDSQLYAHGDLFLIGRSTYVFNAVLRNGETNLGPLEHRFRPGETPAITLEQYSRDYFERRGVFAIPLSAAQLDSAATQYLASKP